VKIERWKNKINAEEKKESRYGTIEIMNSLIARKEMKNLKKNSQGRR